MRQTHFTIVFIVALALAVLSGCGNRPGGYGNFAGVDSVKLVEDAMSALSVNYPPAKTRVALVQEVEDAFGSALVEAMRSAGYAVSEYDPPDRADKYLAAVKKPNGLAFGYVLDGKGDELRVSLHIGTETLSRLYQVQRSGDAAQYIPQGFWTRKQ